MIPPKVWIGLILLLLMGGGIILYYVMVYRRKHAPPIPSDPREFKALLYR